MQKRPVFLSERIWTFFYFIPFLTGSKTPTSRFERNKEDKWEITARKDRDERLTLKDQAKHKEVAF
jgi:hypothetical protein